MISFVHLSLKKHSIGRMEETINRRSNQLE